MIIAPNAGTTCHRCFSHSSHQSDCYALSRIRPITVMSLTCLRASSVLLSPFQPVPYFCGPSDVPWGCLGHFVCCSCPPASSSRSVTSPPRTLPRVLFPHHLGLPHSCGAFSHQGEQGEVSRDVSPLQLYPRSLSPVGVDPTLWGRCPVRALPLACHRQDSLVWRHSLAPQGGLCLLQSSSRPCWWISPAPACVLVWPLSAASCVSFGLHHVLQWSFIPYGESWLGP